MNMGAGSGDLLQTIVNVMKEMQVKNKFMNKNDIFEIVSHNCDKDSFERAISRLLEDGTIYTAYDADVFQLGE